MLEHFFATYPLTTHILTLVLGGPAFGVLANVIVARVFGAGSKTSRFMSTWFGTLPSLIQAVEATGAPNLTQDQHIQRAINALDAAAVSIKLATEAAQKNDHP